MQFESFVTQYSAELLRHATIVSADPDQAQDLVQSVLERAMARWSHIGQLDRPDLYVRRMVINEFISVRRRLRRMHFTDTVPEPDPAPDMANRIVLRTVLMEAIRALPPRERVVVALRHWSGLRDAQIAAEMGCSESTVRGYHLRAVRKLRTAIGKPGCVDSIDGDPEARPVTDIFAASQPNFRS